MSGALEYCLWWVTFVRNGFCPQGTISTIRWPQWDKDQIFKTFFFSYFYIIYRKQLLSSLTNVDNSLAALLVIDKIDSTHCHFHLNPFAFDSTEKSIFCCFVFDLWLLFSTAIKGLSYFWIYLHNGEQFQIIRFLIKHWTTKLQTHKMKTLEMKSKKVI